MSTMISTLNPCHSNGIGIGACHLLASLLLQLRLQVHRGLCRADPMWWRRPIPSLLAIISTSPAEIETKSTHSSTVRLPHHSFGFLMSVSGPRKLRLWSVLVRISPLLSFGNRHLPPNQASGSWCSTCMKPLLWHEGPFTPLFQAKPQTLWPCT